MLVETRSVNFSVYKQGLESSSILYAKTCDHAGLEIAGDAGWRSGGLLGPSN